ncbi:hypothetical protein LOD99_4139 [Oopsacas minuta]|uniref:MIR domain-containing protein n=1 Tax=Oopsacas minuta TaxID=111878 RepID=A0AAV7JUR8_9METZ|nr:hypothetical protein LOD99_4139 [Oopsacas minuta]
MSISDHNPERRGTTFNEKSLDSGDYTMSLSSHPQESLRYGDSIYLVVTGTEPNSIKLVTSYISSPIHLIVTLDEHSYGEDSDPIPDLHMAAFRVLAPNKSQAQDGLTKFMDKLGGRKKLTPEEDNHNFLLKKEVESESKENRSEQKRLIGKEIVYGSYVQLQHHYSGDYLGVSDSQTSVVDRASLKVTLFETNGDHVQFKITPKYKVSNIGDKIRIEDQIVLENVKAQQYLHISNSEIRNSFYGINPNSHEVNASAIDSAFSIYSHIRLEHEITSSQIQNIRGGSVLRLYHLQVQCYVVAAGSCGFDDDQITTEVITNDVHLRTRQIKFGDLKPPSTSAITYWEIELARSPLSGDELKYDEPCRLKHLLTQRYLSIVTAKDQLEMKLVKLSEDASGIDTCFVFKPFINEGKELIEFESYARIYHPNTNSWVKASDKPYESDHVATGPLAMSGFRWDNATCYQVLVEPSKGYHDAFTLEQVDDELLGHFHYVLGYLTVIRNYLLSYNIEIKTSTAMERSLQNLADWMFDVVDNKDRKKRQKLLRNLGIIELMMEIQNRFKEIPHDMRTGLNYERRKNTTKKIYKVIEAYLKGDSRKNENYTAKFIPIFESHFDLNINAEATLIELVRDNKAIIAQFSENFHKVTEELFVKLSATKNSEIFYYFGVMCVANMNPIQENQIVLAKQLLLPEVQESIFLMKLDDPNGDTPTLLATSPIQPEGYKLLSEYVSKHDQNIIRPTFQYLRAQLDFFSNLCQGNNEKAIRTLQQQFSFEVVFSGLTDELIHPLIRVKFAQLINTMFIDVGANRAVLENLTLTFIYEDCTENPGEEEQGASNIALSGVENVYFPRMRDWFKEFFNNLVIYGHEEYTYSNQLIAAVLDMLLLFVKFGYYDDHEDADVLLNLLINILNGKKDRYFPRDGKSKDLPPAYAFFRKTGRYQKTKANAPIFDVKVKCLQIFELFMNFRFYKRLQRLLFLYRVVKKEMKVGGDAPRAILNIIETPEDALYHHLSQLHNPSYNILQHDNLSRKANEHLTEGILAFATYMFENTVGPDSFVNILLDLTQYDNLDLVTTALRLLNNQFMVENNLFERAIQTQVLINDNSIELFKNTDRNLPEFRRLLKASLTNSDICNRLIGLLVTFVEACELPNDRTEAHQQNQKILYNFGILEDVMTLLEKTQDDRTPLVTSSQAGMTAEDGPTRLAKVACVLLCRMATDNLVVQQRLYNRLEILTNETLFDCAPHQLSSLLTQLFTGAQDIVMNVKADDIKLICSLMRPRDTLQLEDIPPIIEILKAITKVEEIDLPLHFNQVHIMNSFMPIKPKHIDNILGTEDGKSARRMELLNSENPQDDDLIILNLMLSTYDLMASLCEGENLHHESVCQSMITQEELLEILNNKKLPFDRKYQFASFFNWVYLNTHKTSSSYDGASVDDDPAFWEFLENTNDVLSAMLAYLDRTSPEEASNIRKTIRNQGDSSLKSDISGSDAKSSMLYIGTFDFGLINYLMKGILPIILVFYPRYFSTRKKEDEALKAFDPLMISFSICGKLFELSIKLQTFLATQYHAKLLYNAALAILTHPEIRSLPLDKIASYVDSEQLKQFSFLVRDENKFVAQPIRDYNLEYMAEIQLNDQFNTYVKHIRRAYWRKNTVKDQIGAMHHTPYSQFLDPLCEHPSPDAMPLGPSFQKHLKLFFKHTDDGCKVEHSIARSIVLQLKYSYDNFYNLNEREKLKQERLDTKSLQLLRGAIHNEILYIDPTLKDDRPVQFRNELEKVEYVQKAIEDLDNTCIKALILIDHPSKSVSSQSIALLADMLYGGNEYIQTQLQALADTREEKFFDQMEAILFYGGNSLVESRSLADELEKRSSFFKEMREHLSQLVILLTDAPRPTTAELRRSPTFTTVDRDDEGDKKPLVLDKSAIELQPVVRTNLSLDLNAPLSYNEQPTKFGEEPEETVNILSRMELIREEAQMMAAAGASDSALQGVAYQNNLRNIQVSFRLMGLMCDGQQKFLQDYFREQPDNPENINMVIKTVNFLKIFYTDINQDNIGLVEEVFRSLTEFVSGNFDNQNDAYGAKIMDVVNRIFQTPTFKSCSLGDMVNLYDSIIRFLQVMLEETSLQTKVLAKELYTVLDIGSVHQVIALLYQVRSDNTVDSAIRDIADEDLFRLYHFIIHLRDFDAILQSEDSSRIIPQENVDQESVLRAWNFCTNRSKSVEVTYYTEDNTPILNKVHFKSLDSGNLSEDVRENVKWNINRDSAEDKLRDFLDWFKAVKIDQNYSYKLRNTFGIKLYLKFQTFRKYFFLLWSLLINIFLLSTWNSPCVSVSTNTINDTTMYSCSRVNPEVVLTPPIPPVVPDWYSYAFFPLGAIHLLLALDLLILFYIVNGINFYIPGIFHRIIPVGFDKRNYRIKWKQPPERRYLQINIIGPKVIFIWMIFLSSILSLPFHGYFYPISLLFILERSDILQRVLLAVTKNGKSLIFVAIFGVIVIYIFSVAGFALFYEQAQATIEPGNSEYVFCRNLFECFISIGRWGLIETVAVILPQRTANFVGEIDRIIFDVLFFVIVTVIGLNIVFGIIVDTFSELRDEKYSQEKDMKSVCFICGIENYLFDRKGKGFKTHVKHEHNMWDYYSFFLYLDSVDPSDHTATESFVFKKLEEDETIFFPQNAARSIPVEEDETAHELTILVNKLEEQSNQLKDILNRVKKLEKN